MHDGELCIASPYAPTSPFRAGNAMGRNKIVYALSKVDVRRRVRQRARVARGPERKKRSIVGYAPVAVWAGDGAKDGNHALIRRGATPITDLGQLFEIDTTVVSPPLQDTLF